MTEKEHKNGAEGEPFIPGIQSGSPRSQFEPEEPPPKDRGNVVLFIIMLHGIGTLIAWNVFITIAPMYYQDLKLKQADPKPAYVANFMNYVCICSQFPNLLVNMIGMFSEKGNLLFRIVVSLCIVAASTLFTIIFIFVDTADWKFGFFILTMVSVVVLNAANGFYQNSIYGLVGSFPFKYINAVVLGNNICGLFVTLLFMLTSYFIEDIQLNAAVYFSIAFLLLITCIISFFYLRKHPYFKYQMAVAQRSRDNQGTLSFSDYVAVFKETWQRLANVFCVFFVTLLLFPSVLLDIQLYPLGREYDLPVIPENLAKTIFIFLNFNTFTVVGSKIADYIQWPSPKYACVPIFSRLFLIILFFFSNYVPSGHRSWPVYLPNEWAVYILISLLSLTHGYYSSLSLMYAPRGLEASKARITGKMSAFFLVLGIACGIGCSFLTNYLAHL
jgi:equilibrative nucleoside transporter 1/2/3